MTGERLRLVTSFDELRSSDLVVGKGCECGREHRGLLTDKVKNWDGAEGFFMRPAIDCRGPGWQGKGALVAENSVRLGLVYLVDTGLEAESETRVEKRKGVRA